KGYTTAALDYGVVRLGNGKRVHLYGAPGQQRFDFMWEVLREGIHGLVLLIDNSRKSPLDDLSFYLKWHQEWRDDHNVVVGVSFMDKSPHPGLREYQAFLQSRRLAIPVMSVDARKRDQVERLIQALWS
ncbi:MAG: GTP-binding protein, partial [Rhodocyclaceae bacterium]